MTTIVFDGKTLAVDTAMYSDNTYSGEISKVREIELNGKKCLIAMCGEFADFEPFISKITGGECNHDTSGSAFIVININDPSDYTAYEKNAPMQHPLPYCNGSGHQIALGAMHQGSDPVCAVKAACKYNAFTEYPIEVFRFKKKGEYKYSKIEKPA